MRPPRDMLWRCLACSILGLLPCAADPVLTVESAGNGVLPANYTTSKLFVDEVAGTFVPVTVTFSPDKPNLTAVEVYTNLNRRDRAGGDADGDTVEDGILPPSGDLVVAGSDAHYYAAYTMTDIGGGAYRTTINASKTGAYRLTARFKTSDAIAENGNDPSRWIYYSNANESNPSGRRDHAIVISPVIARDIRLYELNVLNVEAEGTGHLDRSTFVDLHDGVGSKAFQRWDLDTIGELGANWLWFQPIHPYGVDGRHLSAADINARAPGSGATTWKWNAGTPSEDVNYSYALGSPYAVKNFFEIAPQMSKGNTRAAAMTEFQNFVSAADVGGVSVMLDAAFNHTAWDCEAGPLWEELGFGVNAATEIRSHEAKFFSKTDNYAQRASSAADIAPAPDRYDFGKWLDAKDVFFGRYDALVANSGDVEGRKDEGDWFDTSPASGSFDTVTHNTWRYFAAYVPYWLDKTGHPLGTPAAEHHKGIDGLRCDFGQGLPPRAWEYIINKARSLKWSFVFMAESLDGGAVTYRSNRHFDILNESILFALQSAGSVPDYRTALESRRSQYGSSVVLLNTTSHDEENYTDPWQALIRYAVVSSVDGAPMIFQGQELGLSEFYGYDLMEKNLSKYVPHFKTYNSMMPLWGDTDFGNAQLKHVYGGINRARAASPALRSPNRYFLNLKVGGAHNEVWGVAKYEVAEASPAFSDVVFAFVNTDRDNDRPSFPEESTVFDVDIPGGGAANQFGINPSRTYNVKNLAAYNGQTAGRDGLWLWGAGQSGADIIANGVLAELNKVPTSAGAWSSDPYEPLFLKLYDVTPPPAPEPRPEGYFVVGSDVDFQLHVFAEPDDNVSAFRVDVGTSPGGNDVADELAVGADGMFNVNAPAGSILYVTAVAISAAGVESPAGSSAPGAPDPDAANTPVAVLDPAGDEDGDLSSNATEDAAGTNPFDAASRFELISISENGSGGIDITFNSDAEPRLYTVRSCDDLVSWQDEDEAGAIDFPGSGGATTTFTDTNPSPGRKFYQVLVRKP